MSLTSEINDAAANSPAVLAAWHKLADGGAAGGAGLASFAAVADASGLSHPFRNASVTTMAGANPIIAGDPSNCIDFTPNQIIDQTYSAWMANVKGGGVWFKADTVSGAYHQLMDRDDGVNRCFQFRINPSGKLEFIYWNAAGAGPTVLTGGTTIVAGTVYRASWGIDSTDTKMKIWLNGVVDASSASGSQTLFNSASIGWTYGRSNGSGGTFYFDGRMSHAILWTTNAPTTARELAIYNAGVTAPPAAPNVPTSVGASSSSGTTADLTWLPPSGGGPVSSYEVRINGGSPVTATSTHTFTGLTPGTTYTLEVRAVGAGGNSAYVSASVTTVALPNVPTSVNVSGLTYTSGDLAWSAPSGGGPVSSYQARVDAGAPVTATSPHTFTGLSPGATHTFEVRAVGAGGVSAYVSVSGDTLSPPPGYYRVTVEIEPPGGSVDPTLSYDVTSGDPKSHGVLLPITLGWSLPDSVEFFPCQADLTTLTLSIQVSDASELAGVVRGSRVLFNLYLSPDPDADPWQHLEGVVTQLDGQVVTAAGNPDAYDFRATLYCGDGNTALADIMVGYTDDWPIEGIEDRVMRICDEAGITYATGGVAFGSGMRGWLSSRDAASGPISALEAIRSALKDSADDYTSESPLEFYGRYVFGFDIATQTLTVQVFRRRAFSGETATLDGAAVHVDGAWSKRPGPHGAAWVIVDGTTFGTPGVGVPYVRQTSLLDYFGDPPGSEINYSAGERDTLGESLLADGSTALDGWSTRSVIYEASVDPDPVTMWASFSPLANVIPVVVTPIAGELELNGVDYLAGTLTGARLVLTDSPARKLRPYFLELTLRSELLPGTDLP